MSRDKRKKWDRAMRYIRALGAPAYPGLQGGDRVRSFSGPPSALMRYCVERGLATIRRTKPGEWYAGRGRRPPRHNVFDADA